MERLKRVLVAVDFSACSAAALSQADRIAAWHGAAVTVFHGVPLPVYAVDPQPFFPLVMPDMEIALAEAREQWGKWPAARGLRTPVAFEASVGTPRFEILGRVDRLKPDLLVMGAHGDLDAKRHLGSTAAACLQHSACNVLLVRENQTGPFRSVLACVDLTDRSSAIIEQALRTAAQNDAALHLLHVYDAPWRGAPPAAVTANMPDIEQRYRSAVEERIRAVYASLSHELTALKAEVHAVQSDGPKAHGKAIVEFAARERCDLAVLGTRAGHAIRDLVLGSTATRVVRDAPCSVLAVKPPAPPAA